MRASFTAAPGDLQHNTKAAGPSAAGKNNGIVGEQRRRRRDERRDGVVLARQAVRRGEGRGAPVRRLPAGQLRHPDRGLRLPAPHGECSFCDALTERNRRGLHLAGATITGSTGIVEMFATVILRYLPPAAGARSAPNPAMVAWPPRGVESKQVGLAFVGLLGCCLGVTNPASASGQRGENPNSKNQAQPRTRAFCCLSFCAASSLSLPASSADAGVFIGATSSSVAGVKYPFARLGEIGVGSTSLRWNEAVTSRFFVGSPGSLLVFMSELGSGNRPPASPLPLSLAEGSY